MDRDSKRLHVAVTDGRGRAVRAPGLARWLERIAPSIARGEVAVALVSDAHIRALNRRFLAKDRATDVLSFPASAAAPLRRGKHARPGTGAPRASRLAPRVLGDIVIATGVARRQARGARLPYRTELKVLALHGLLHLLGYDHHDPADRGRMAQIERRLRARGGLRAGLIERARATRA